MTINNWQTIPDDHYYDIYQKTKTLKPIKTADSLHVYEEQYEIDGSIYRLLSEIGGDIVLIQKFIDSFEI